MSTPSGIGLAEGWLEAATAWAAANECVVELWLFGSRAKGTAYADSDIDLGIVLAPIRDGTDWALGTYYSEGTLWRRQLEGVTGAGHVSLIDFNRPGEDAPDEIIAVRAYAQRLWARA